jgi:hypothetical protein
MHTARWHPKLQSHGVSGRYKGADIDGEPETRRGYRVHLHRHARPAHNRSRVPHRLERLNPTTSFQFINDHVGEHRP